METRALAEAIILQSIEDLWDEGHRKASISFFSSKHFSIVAELARMSSEERLILLKMVRRIKNGSNKGYASSADRANSSPLALSAPPNI
jgi:hypothetical protein